MVQQGIEADVAAGPVRNQLDTRLYLAGQAGQQGAVLGIVLPQHLRSDGQTGRQLGQQIRLVLGQGKHTLPGQQAVAVALAGGADQQLGQAAQRQLAVAIAQGHQCRGLLARPATQCLQCRFGGLGLRGCPLLLAKLAGHRLLRARPEQTVHVERATRLGTCAGEPFAAERLHPDHGAHYVAVDVEVADLGGVDHLGDGLVDAGMDSQSQAVAAVVDLREQLA
ncbi:hypothetical protein D3C84_554610 [compost metagenome]